MTAFSYLPVLLALAGSTPAKTIKPVAAMKTVTACIAATQADVEDALGRTLARGKEQTDAVQSSCDYAAGDGQVTVTIRRSGVKLDVPAQIADLKAAIPQGRIRELPGVGRQAFFMDLSGAGTQLHVIRGDGDYVLVSVLGLGEPEDVAKAAEKIARKVLDRF
ncbi:MAG TPA: hypothetical protein VKU01_29015 [Bryobacteraceae bacterium]|nr:hypothetical protein [Bryobacteraceae bacterium]